MDDTISRQAAIDALHTHLMYRMGTDSNKKRLDEWINNLPSAQPEIIRCRDCDWWTKQPDSLQGRCALSGTYPTGGFFCGNAKQRPYPCDPEKNQDCSKTGCYINGGECRHTLNKEYAREEDE